MKRLDDKTADELIEDAIRLQQDIYTDLQDAGRMLALVNNQHRSLALVLCRLRVVQGYEQTKEAT